MTALNFEPWEGWSRTLQDTTKFHAMHTKSTNRPTIQDTYVETIADRTARYKNRGQYLSVGQRVREVYHSCLQFDEPEEEWQFSRILGCGSFGLACLWKKQSGYTLSDELVTKSEEPTRSYCVHPNRLDIPKEAFHLAQLNELRDEDGYERDGVVKLRGFKLMLGGKSTQGDGTNYFQPDPDNGHTNQPLYSEWRTFLENCNQGTLTRIVMTYRAWGYHVPEAFVWWTFLWLMEACKAMEQEEDGFYKVNDDGGMAKDPETFMLSNDIKHDNIFVGDSNGQCHQHYALGAPFNMYPAARMADFGLSTLAKIDIENRARRIPGGTNIWMAPEKRRIEMDLKAATLEKPYIFYRHARVDPPTWAKGPENTQSHCIGPEANTWSAAVAVLLLMTLGDIWKTDAIVREMISLRNQDRDDDNVPQYLFQLENFATHLSGNEDYSDELKQLVQECTRIEPTKRPHIDDILNDIRAGIQREFDRLHREFDTEEDVYRATRMAISNSEWLEVPQGPFLMMPRSIPSVPRGGSDEIDETWREFYEVVEEWADPVAPTMVPPGQWREYRDGDPKPNNWTAGNPRPNHAVLQHHRLPYYGTDWILYTERHFMDGYHQGPALPKGGRAWRSQ